MKNLPKFLKNIFWDVDFNKLNKNKHKFFIIERILEYGDDRTVKWMYKNYKKEEIEDVVSNSRRLSKRSSNFWKIIFSKI